MGVMKDDDDGNDITPEMISKCTPGLKNIQRALFRIHNYHRQQGATIVTEAGFLCTMSYKGEIKAGPLEAMLLDSWGSFV